jgi:hypothetical protein
MQQCETKLDSRRKNDQHDILLQLGNNIKSSNSRISICNLLGKHLEADVDIRPKSCFTKRAMEDFCNERRHCSL